MPVTSGLYRPRGSSTYRRSETLRERVPLTPVKPETRPERARNPLLVEGNNIKVLSERWMDQLIGPERDFTGEDEGFSEDFPALGDWLRSGRLWYVK